MNTNSSINPAQRQGIKAAIFCTAFIALSWGLAAPLISQHLERMTGSGSLLGWLVSLAAVATILITPFVPKLMSRYSLKPILIISIIIGAATLPLMKVFMSPGAWFVLKFIASSAFTVVFVVAEIWINSQAPESLRGRILGVYGAALAGGMGVGSGLAVLTGIDGWTPFILCALINLAAALPILYYKNAAMPEQTPSDAAQFSIVFKIMRAAPAIMVCGFVFGAIEQSITYFLPVYDTRLGHSEHMARILLLAVAAGNVLFQIPMGMLADKMDRSRLSIYLMISAFIGPMLIIAAGTQFYLIAALAFIYVGLSTALYTVGIVQLGERFKGHHLAAANAAFIMAYGIGSLIVPPIAGKMMDVIYPYGFMWIMAGLGLFGLCVVLVRRLRLRP